MSLSARIVAGLLLGVAVGIFIGERAAALEVVGDAFIQLLQMTVLPYVTVSLILGLGRLGYSEATLLARRAGSVLLLLWAMSIGLVLLMPLVFPLAQSGAFFSTALLEEPPQFDFLDLYIPKNPFYALANSVVPAVVLFSVAVGVALIGVENKSAFMDALDAFSKALTRVTNFVVSLTPIGVFAIVASAAGTLSPDELERLQVFLVSYVVIALLMTFWLLPGLVAALTPLRYGEVVGLTRDALVTAFATSSLFIVLPVLAQRSKEMLARVAPDDPEVASAVDVVVPVSFSFPSSAKLLSLSFLLFAAWYSGTELGPTQYPTLIFTGVVSFFGSLNAAVPFLLDLMRIPSDMFGLFVATSVVNARFGTLLAAVHTLVVALLGASAVHGLLRPRPGALARYVAISVLLVAATLGGLRLFFAATWTGANRGAELLERMQPVMSTGRATVHAGPAVAPEEDPSRPLLERIHERGRLRVGFREFLPLAFFHEDGELVGLDIEMAQLLARDLGVELELIPVTLRKASEYLEAGVVDVAMPGLAITTERLEAMRFSETYLDLTLAFAVPDHRREDFGSRSALQRLSGLRIGVPPVPYYVTMLQRYLPQAELVEVSEPADFFEGEVEDLDAFLFAAEAISAWSLLHPQFSVAIPHPDVVKVPVAYAVAGGDAAMASFLSGWIDLKRKDGTLQALYDHWILGLDADVRGPRWSVIRDVLHWVD
ncbi:MAG: cation:dicarboxylase symporter family transporter [Myxococcota bacterium]|nr:cation:dicarboxylase symporter family transporter [Myxococcota bacterium]